MKPREEAPMDANGMRHFKVPLVEETTGVHKAYDLWCRWADKDFVTLDSIALAAACEAFVTLGKRQNRYLVAGPALEIIEDEQPEPVAA